MLSAVSVPSHCPKRFDTVFPAAGSSNSAIELTCDELYHYGNCVEWVDICKGWQEEA